MKGIAGSTLLETLLGVAIVAVLAGLATVSIRSVLSKAMSARELGAARNVMAAYLAFAGDNNGRLLPGIVEDPSQIGLPEAVDRTGNPLGGYLAKRWPYRLAPYFNYEYPGVAVVNDSLTDYRKQTTPAMAEYIASVQPSLGLNTTFVGGNYALHHGEPRIDTDAETYGNFCVTRLGQAIKPGTLIVFVSAHFKTSAGSAPGAQGNFYVLSPRLFSQRWSDKFDSNATSDRFGHVHPRWNKKAVAVNLDGSSTLLGEEDLKDMRRWSNQAAEQDDPNWTLEAL
ncbi:MAG: type II secretion system protein [Terrimicrobiaceae bacterium]